MSLEHELVASSLVLADQREYIQELQQLIRDFDEYMRDMHSYTYGVIPRCIVLRERVRELLPAQRGE